MTRNPVAMKQVRGRNGEVVTAPAARAKDARPSNVHWLTPRTWRRWQVTPSSPLNLTSATTFFVYVDGYGGAPGASGYQATVTLTSGSQTLTTTVPVPANAWTPVDVDVSSWAYRGDITGISVSYAAVGSTTLWSMQFQIDDVGWS